MVWGVLVAGFAFFVSLGGIRLLATNTFFLGDRLPEPKSRFPLTGLPLSDLKGLLEGEWRNVFKKESEATTLT